MSNPRATRDAVNSPWEKPTAGTSPTGQAWDFETGEPVPIDPLVRYSQYWYGRPHPAMPHGAEYSAALGVQVYRVTLSTGMQDMSIVPARCALDVEERMKRTDVTLVAKDIEDFGLSGSVWPAVGTSKYGFEMQVIFEVSTSDVLGMWNLVQNLLVSCEQHSAYVTINGERPQLWIKGGMIEAIT